MGIVNMTPDSFSGDGVGGGVDPCAVGLAQAERMLADGATAIDIGGESTRPGATAVSVAEEKARILPLIAELHARHPALTISVDTMKEDVARAAFAAGASIFNDVSGAAQTDRAFSFIAETSGCLVLMHNGARVDSVERSSGIGGVYVAAATTDIVRDVYDGLARLKARALACGVAEAQIILDPGLGFGKSAADNRRLVRALPQLKKLGSPVLVGASRKSFIGQTLNLPPDERLEGSLAVAVLAVFLGADIIRAHDVAATSRAMIMAHAIATDAPL
jgi:dihydropteroate synthase